MRAVVLRDGRLEVREIADPVPGPGELLLRTLSTAICASDVHFMDHPEMGVNDPTGPVAVRRGPRHRAGPRVRRRGHRPRTRLHRAVPGRHPGDVDADAAGRRRRRRRCGSSVSTLRRKAASANCWSSQRRWRGQSTARSPATPSALVDAFAVGEFYVRAARLQPGEIPIVIGAGAVGLSAVAALAGRGVDPIIVSDFKAERREIAATSFGAHVLVDPAERTPSTCSARCVPSADCRARWWFSNVSAASG